METEIMNIPILKKLAISHSKSPANINSGPSCCTPKADAAQCCSPSQSKEEPDGACCAQPEDGSDCCNKN